MADCEKDTLNNAVIKLEIPRVILYRDKIIINSERLDYYRYIFNTHKPFANRIARVNHTSG